MRSGPENSVLSQSLHPRSVIPPENALGTGFICIGIGYKRTKIIHDAPIQNPKDNVISTKIIIFAHGKRKIAAKINNNE